MIQEMSLYFLTAVWLLFCMIGCFCLPDGDLCRWMNGRKYYIDVGESGTITLWNVTSQASGTSNSHPRIPQRCSVELITCPSCHVVVSILYLNIPSCSTDGSCRCDYVWIREPAYSKSGQEFCGVKANESSLFYESKTKLVSVDFLYSYSYTDAFSLQFTAKKNIYHLKGGHDYYQSNNTGYFESPYFPMSYPSDYMAEYILHNLETNGFVHILFTDFQLSPWSYIELFDSNGTRIDVYNGNVFRPPAISSSGPTLSLKFRANDEHSTSGFKAKYTFVNYPEKYWFNKPSTDCGGLVDDFGGAITMMNMASGKALQIYDCIWLIHPRSTNNYETHIAIRVAQFEDMGTKSSLEIRQGLTSESYLLESVTGYQHHKIPRGQEYVVPSTSGFYVRLRGFFGNKSHLAITYSSFRYDDCYTTGDFECGNGRCIKHALRCDGFNHCGDGTDEAACFGSSKGAINPDDASWWRTMTPNYYFPKQTNSSGSGTNTLILITSLAGLGMFVLTTVMILVKLHRQRHDDSSSREALHTISGDIDTDNTAGNRTRISSDPPMYDPPPSYDDVVKYYLPPPPTYNSVMESCNGNSHQTSACNNTDGFTNSAFIPDTTDTRQQGEHVHSEQQQQPLLRVMLPSSPERVCNVVPPTVETIQVSTRPETSSAELSNTEPNSVSLSEMFLGNHSSQPSSIKPEDKSANTSHRNQLKRAASICDCRGACSCPLSTEIKLRRLKCQVQKVILDRQVGNKLGKSESIKTNKEQRHRHATLPLYLSKSNDKAAGSSKQIGEKRTDRNNHYRINSQNNKPSNSLFPFLQGKNGNFQNSVLSSLSSLAHVLRDPKLSSNSSGQGAKSVHSKISSENRIQHTNPVTKTEVFLINGESFKIPCVSLKEHDNYHSTNNQNISIETNHNFIKSSNNLLECSCMDKNCKTTDTCSLRKVSSQPNLFISPQNRQKYAVHHKHSKSDAGENFLLNLTLSQEMEHNKKRYKLQNL